ncbi:hypothetical protein Syun_029856 [Stephania yunnanensis]|uniref:Uncharacterized protein n=1 Tax=Stephania yunnanensis TaxID=152371 RepID=A0AAP0HJY2_9MAGN
MIHESSATPNVPIYKLNLMYKVEKTLILSLKCVYGDGKASRLYSLLLIDLRLIEAIIYIDFLLLEEHTTPLFLLSLIIAGTYHSAMFNVVRYALIMFLGITCVYDDPVIEKYLLQCQSRSPPSLPKQINIRIPFVDPSITDYNLLAKNYSPLIHVDAKAKDENHMSSVHLNGAIPVTAMHFDIAPRILISGDQCGVVRIFKFKTEPFSSDSSLFSLQGNSKKGSSHIVQSVKIVKVNGAVSLIDIEGLTLLFQQHIPSYLAGVISLQFGTGNFQGFEKNTLLVATKDLTALALDVETGNTLNVSDDSDLNKRNSSLLLCNEKAVYIYSLPHAVQGIKKVQFKKKFHGVSCCCWVSTFCKHDFDVALALLFTSDKIENFLLCPISSSLLSSLASIDRKSFGLNVKSGAIDEDSDAVLEWENLPPLVHISHCKAAPDLIYGCVPPLLLSLLS